MNIYPLAPLLAFVISLSLAIFIWFRDRRSPLNRIFALFCIFAAYEALTDFGYRQAGDLQTANFWLKMWAFWPLVFVTLLHFILVFTKQSRLLRHKATYLLLYVPALAISFIDLSTDLLTSGSTKES